MISDTVLCQWTTLIRFGRHLHLPDWSRQSFVQQHFRASGKVWGRGWGSSGWFWQRAEIWELRSLSRWTVDCRSAQLELELLCWLPPFFFCWLAPPFSQPPATTQPPSPCYHPGLPARCYQFTGFSPFTTDVFIQLLENHRNCSMIQRRREFHRMTWKWSKETSLLKTSKSLSVVIHSSRSLKRSVHTHCIDRWFELGNRTIESSR